MWFGYDPKAAKQMMMLLIRRRFCPSVPTMSTFSSTSWTTWARARALPSRRNAGTFDVRLFWKQIIFYRSIIIPSHPVLIGRWEGLLQTVSESVHNATGGWILFIDKNFSFTNPPAQFTRVCESRLMAWGILLASFKLTRVMRSRNLRTGCQQSRWWWWWWWKIIYIFNHQSTGWADPVRRAEISAIVPLTGRAHIPRRPLHLFPCWHPAPGPRQPAQGGGGGAVQPVGSLPPSNLRRVIQDWDLPATALAGG